jgi:sortase A
MTGLVMPVPSIAVPAATAARPERVRSRVEAFFLQVAVVVTLLVVLSVAWGAFLYGLSGVSEARTQTNLRKTFSRELGLAVAPVGPTAEGKPMAALSIPKLGMTNTIVVEGTNTRDLSTGPGHRVDSVFPGQPGVSVFYGRRVTYGAPFAHLMQLQVGDTITVLTGQGKSVYRVSSFGNSKHPSPANSPNRLVLITSDTSTSYPDGIVSVSADLVSPPLASNGIVGTPARDQVALSLGVDHSLLPTLLWAQALFIVVVGAVIAAHRWTPVAAYLCAVPILFAVLWNLLESTSLLIVPNLY